MVSLIKIDEKYVFIKTNEYDVIKGLTDICVDSYFKDKELCTVFTCLMKDKRVLDIIDEWMGGCK